MTLRACHLASALTLTAAFPACSDAEPDRPRAHPDPMPSSEAAAAVVECDADGDACTRHGQTGHCLRHRCILPSGFCSYDVDCLDGNACASTRCVAGECDVSYLDDTACDEGAGTCEAGFCVHPPPASCERDRECSDATPVCTREACVDGACAFEPDADGASCRLPSFLPGRCQGGTCVPGEVRTDRGERCRVVMGYFGPQEQCERRTRFALDPSELAAESARLAERIRESVLYDVEVVLVPLADGGYNILAFNRHPRTDVRGLVDPSFVAFEVAGFTETSDWKSRMLQVWLDPYEDGWQISTSGGRRAVRHGREASLLGALGVVDIKSFRTWLQRAFAPIPRPAPERLGQVPAPPDVPARLDAPGSPSDFPGLGMRL